MQNNIILPLVTNISKKKGPKTLHLNNENNLQNIEENYYECTGVSSGSCDTYSEFTDIVNFYEHLYESKRSPIFEEENVILPETNQKKLPDLLLKYVKIFLKCIYYIGKIKIEFERIFLKL